MIELKKLNGAAIFINPDLIRIVEATPDTVVHFLDGESMLVRDTPQEIVSRIISFRKTYSFSAALIENNEELKG